MEFILKDFTTEDIDEQDTEVTAGMISMMALSLLNQFPSFYFDKKDWEKLSQSFFEVIELAKARIDEQVQLDEGFEFFEADSNDNKFYIMKARNMEEATKDAVDSFGDRFKFVKKSNVTDAKIYLKEMGFIPVAGLE